MRNFVRRAATFIIVFALVIGMVPASDMSRVDAASKVVKRGGVVYKILDGKKLTAKVTSASKGIKKAVIEDNVTIGGKAYKVVLITDKAFRNQKKLASVTIGKNVTQIGKNAFQNDKKLKSITIKSEQLKTIGKSAFSGICKDASFVVPYGMMSKMSRLIKNKKIGYKKTMKLVESDKASDDEAGDKTDDKSKDDKVSDDKSKDDKVTEDKAKDDKVTDDKSKDDKVTDDKSKDDKVTDDKTKDDDTKDDDVKDDDTKDDDTKGDDAKDDDAKDDDTKDDDTKDDDVKDDDNTNEVKYEQYSYSVVPMLGDVCNYFYVKTDNPEPTSFILVDDDTTISENEVQIKVKTTVYTDVKYEDEENYRVNGGYIFYGYGSDGGELKLEKRVQKSSYSYEYEDTGVTLTCPKLVSDEQYLIDTYTNSSMGFFEKMDAVQKGLNSICLYSGVYVLGELHKSETSPYYGLSTSPHVDQNFYIQDPYYRSDSKSMLVSALYPYILDSLGFPGEMGAVAKLIDSSVTYKRNSNAHWLIDVTYNGETKSYGGQGNGGGQGINEDMINHQYTFDGSENDFSTKKAWADIKGKICEYGAMTVPSEIPENEALTWQQVTDTVGAGSYVQLVLITSVFGGVGKGYSYMYDKGSSFPGYMYDCWYDGRYFNRWEFFEKGAKFEDHPDVGIVIKDFVAELPDPGEGKKYFYDYSNDGLSKIYDEETGTWKGYIRFNYDSETKTWKSSILNSLRIGDANRAYYYAEKVQDESITALLTLTQEEVATMNIDGNTDVDPTDYYIYDMVTPPGTKVGN